MVRVRRHVVIALGKDALYDIRQVISRLWARLQIHDRALAEV
jgi:hypothetical protein